MHAKADRNRHGISLPIAGLLGLMVYALHLAVVPASASLVPQSPSTMSTRWVASDDTTTIHAEQGLTITLEPGAIVETDPEAALASLITGTAIFDATGLATVHVGCALIRLVGATASLVQSVAGLTIAPIDGPVSVQTCAGDIRYVALGWQFAVSTAQHDVSLSPVPASWLATRRTQMTPHRATAVAAALVAQVAGERASPPCMALLQGARDPDDSWSQLCALRLIGDLHPLDTDVQEAFAAALLTQGLLTHTDFILALPSYIHASPRSIPTTLREAWLHSSIASSEDRTALTDALRELPTALRLGGYPEQALMWERAITNLTMAYDAVMIGSKKDPSQAKGLLHLR